MTAVGARLSQRAHRSGQWKLCAHCKTRFVRRANMSAPEWRRRIYCGVACGNVARHESGVLFQKPVVPDPGWMSEAACLDSRFDFVPDSKEAAAGALSACRGVECPVRQQCLAFATATRAYGVWGGKYFVYGEAKTS